MIAHDGFNLQRDPRPYLRWNVVVGRDDKIYGFRLGFQGHDCYSVAFIVPRKRPRIREAIAIGLGVTGNYSVKWVVWKIVKAKVHQAILEHRLEEAWSVSGWLPLHGRCAKLVQKRRNGG